MRISIEGSIASGKSTCLTEVSARVPDASVFLEPLDEWQYWLESNEPGNTFSLQLAVLLTYTQQARGPHNVFERGIHSCVKIFGPLCLHGQQLELFDSVVANVANVWMPDHIIYIRVPPDQCHRRMTLRGRDYEKHSLNYLQRLHDSHEAAIEELKPDRVTIVDGTRSPEEVAQEVCDVVKRLLAAGGT